MALHWERALLLRTLPDGIDVQEDGTVSEVGLGIALHRALIPVLAVLWTLIAIGLCFVI